MYLDIRDIKRIETYLLDYKRLLRKELLMNNGYGMEEIKYRIEIINKYIKAIENETRNISIAEMITLL